MIIVDKKYIKNFSKLDRQNHLNLEDSCIERGGGSTNHRGILAEYLDSTIPQGRILLCHACHNPKCSNPKHLYWGTDSENYEDALENKTQDNIYNRTILKYGEKKTKEIASIAGKKSGKARVGLKLSNNHKENISKSLTGRKLSEETKQKMKISAKNRKTKC